MRAQELTAGQTIAERYRLIALRGTGSTGSVWRAVHLLDQRECALKLLHRCAADRRTHQAERFLREARAASSIDSLYAVRVLDYGIHGDVPFIAMELLEGETLASRLHAAGRLSPEETSRIIDQIAAAVGSAHELGIVHRDLKPENIFLARSAQGAVAKVLDFGIAKLQDEAAVARDLTQTGGLLGTPRYMSPEQIEGARHVDQRADLWALAVIAFECITGQQPFQGDSLRALFASICVQPSPLPSARCAVPHGFDAWFLKGTHSDPGKRFQSAAALARALRDACERELSETATADEPAAHGVGAAPVRAAAQRRNPRLWLVLASASAVAIIAGWITLRALAVEPRSELPRAPAATKPDVRGSGPAAVAAFERVAPQPSRSPTPQPSSAPPASAKTPPSAERLPPARRLKLAQPARRGADAAWDLDVILRDRK